MDTFTSREGIDTLKEKVVNDIYKDKNKYNIEIVKNIINNKKNQIIVFMGAGNINNEICKILKF